MIKMLALALALLSAPHAETSSDRYAVGQVWEYRTRPEEPGSVLMIREIEDVPPIGWVYHVSIIGIRPDATWGPTQIDHSPVSRETLDSSVTRLSTQHPQAPDYQPGLAQWRSEHGGVFTIPVAEIVDVIDQQMGGP